MPITWDEASSEVIQRAQVIIHNFHPDLWDANICFLFRSKGSYSGGRPVIGKASKVPARYKALIDFDFII